MVLFGPTFHRYFARAALTFLLVVGVATTHAQPSNAQPADVAGTMPEDVLPELKTILSTAMTRSPNVLGALFEIELRQIHRIRDNAPRWPSLGGDINFGTTQVSESGSSNASSRDQGLFYRFGLNQALYHWGALKNQSAIAKINVLLAEKNYAKAYRDLGVLIRQSYLDLIVQKAKLKQEREALRIAREGLTSLQERVDRGLSTATEIAGEKLRIQVLNHSLSQTEKDLLGGRETFSRIAGIPKISEEAIPGDLPRPVYSDALTTILLSSLLRDGAKGTLEAEIHDLKIREAQIRYDIEKVRNLPKFGLGLGYSLENTTTVGTAVGQKAVARQSASIGASWNIFDGGTTRALKMEALETKRLQTDRRKAELDLLMETAQGLERQLKLDAEGLELAEIQRSMATQQKERAEQETQLGNLSGNAVGRAEVGVLLAHANNLAARASYFIRWSEFVATAGNDPVLNNLPASHARSKK
jgi:outer membrane protein TolC